MIKPSRDIFYSRATTASPMMNHQAPSSMNNKAIEPSQFVAAVPTTEQPSTNSAISIYLHSRIMG
jgi:hypothetical protein